MKPTDDDVRQFRHAVESREPVHPFTTGRWQALGWVARGKSGDAFFSGPSAHAVTEAGEAILSRREAPADAR